MNRTTPTTLFLLAVAACTSPLGTDPVGPTDGASGITAAARPVPSLVIEKISGDCASGITVRVTGQNLSARSRFGYQWLGKTDLTGFPAVGVELGNGNKKSVQWTTFWPAETINPATGAKFSGKAAAYVTDAWTGWLHETGQVTIAPAC